LRRYDLFDKTIVLPNEATVRYDRYTVPCCAECNALMGDEIEGPISEILQGGIDRIADLLRRLRPLQVDTMPLDVAPPRSTRFGSPLVLSRVHWVRPELVVAGGPARVSCSTGSHTDEQAARSR
jgi:hypothetical protein